MHKKILNISLMFASEIVCLSWSSSLPICVHVCRVHLWMYSSLITYCGRYSLLELIYTSPSLIGPHLWFVKVRRPYPPLTTFPACPDSLDCLLCQCRVLVSVLSVGWSVICCSEVVEVSARRCVDKRQHRNISRSFYACMYLCIYMNMCVCIYEYVSMRIFMYIYAHIYLFI